MSWGNVRNSRCAFRNRRGWVLEIGLLLLEVAVGASSSHWLALQTELRARCAQVAPARRLVRRSLCVHRHPHQLFAPVCQPTLLSDLITYPAAGTMLHGVVDRSCCALFTRAAADALREPTTPAATQGVALGRPCATKLRWCSCRPLVGAVVVLRRCPRVQPHCRRRYPAMTSTITTADHRLGF